MGERVRETRAERAGVIPKPSEPFVIRIHADAGYIILPHTHLVDENIVVVQGIWSLGMGPRCERSSLEQLDVVDLELVSLVQAVNRLPLRVMWPLEFSFPDGTRVRLSLSRDSRPAWGARYRVDRVAGDRYFYLIQPLVA